VTSFAFTETVWSVKGRRGLKGGSSLVRLLAKKRSRSLYETLPPLTIEEIRAWALAYKQKHERWPERRSGHIENTKGETWLAIWVAMYQGSRGLKRRVEVGEVFRD
jgi:hypothetical protein